MENARGVAWNFPRWVGWEAAGGCVPGAVLRPTFYLKNLESCNRAVNAFKALFNSQNED